MRRPFCIILLALGALTASVTGAALDGSVIQGFVRHIHGLVYSVVLVVYFPEQVLRHPRPRPVNHHMGRVYVLI